MSNEKLFHQPFHEWLDMALRSDDYISIPYDLALCIQEFDKSNQLSYVEITKKGSYLWRIKAWRSSELARNALIVKNKQERIEWDNLKENLNRIAKCLVALTNQDFLTCYTLAQDLLKKPSVVRNKFGVELVEPYFMGNYTFMPEPRK